MFVFKSLNVLVGAVLLVFLGEISGCGSCGQGHFNYCLQS